MSDNDFLLPPQTPALPPTPLVRKLGLGAALIAVPLATGWIFMQLQNHSNKQNLNQEKGAAYDDANLRKIDPALIKYHQINQIDTGLRAPRAMAVDSKGDLLVVGDKMVRIFSNTGQRLIDIPLADAPSCIVPSKTGDRIYVGFNDHVEVYDAAGKRLAVWPKFSDKSQLTGLALRGDELLVADSGEHRRIVVRCDLDGHILGELGGRDDARGNLGLIAPSPHINVAAKPDGQVLISNPGRFRIETYSVDGILQGFFGQSGTRIQDFLGCCNPANFGLLSDGRIVTAEKGIPRVKVYLPDGRLDSVVVGPDAFGQNMLGLELAIDPFDRILVLEPGTTTVRIFQAKKAGQS